MLTFNKYDIRFGFYIDTHNKIIYIHIPFVILSISYGKKISISTNIVKLNSCNRCKKLINTGNIIIRGDEFILYCIKCAKEIEC